MSTTLVQANTHAQVERGEVVSNKVEVNSCLTHRFPENEQWYDKTYSYAALKLSS